MLIKYIINYLFSANLLVGLEVKRIIIKINYKEFNTAIKTAVYLNEHLI